MKQVSRQGQTTPELLGQGKDFGLDLKRNGKPVMCLKPGRRGGGDRMDLHFKEISLAV